MEKFLRTYIAPLLGSISLLMLPAALIAAETITASGYAYITSSVNKEVFRARAVENALQKIVLESGQDLNSFSIVENGQVLLDQIQTRSNVKILKYDIIEEKIKNKKYHITLRAILANNDKNKTSNTCKKVNIQSADFSLKIIINQNHFPAWVNLTKDWVLSELRKHAFNPELTTSKSINSKTNLDNLYSLYDQKQFLNGPKNIYKLDTEIIIERENKHNLIEKTTILSAKIKTKLKRNNTIISETQFTQPYRIQQRVYNNLFQTAHRGDWGKIKQHFSNLLKKRLDGQIVALDCVSIEPRVFTKSGTPFVDYGLNDGIELSDMFVIRSESSKKTFLKIVALKPHEAQIQIISKQENIENIEGKFVELVAGS